MDTTVWVILGIIVLLAIIAFVVLGSRKRREVAHREEAARLRTQAAEHDRELREREADAASADAQARRARAEADERAAGAERLEVEAERRDEKRAKARHARDEQLRRADALDPDVRTDKDGHRLDDDRELADPYSNRGERRLSDPSGDERTVDARAEGYGVERADEQRVDDGDLRGNPDRIASPNDNGATAVDPRQLRRADPDAPDRDRH